MDQPAHHAAKFSATHCYIHASDREEHAYPHSHRYSDSVPHVHLDGDSDTHADSHAHRDTDSYPINLGLKSWKALENRLGGIMKLEVWRLGAILPAYHFDRHLMEVDICL